MDARRLLLGDWHPLVRDPLDIGRASLVVGAVAYAAAGEGEAAAFLGAGALGALLARVLLLPRAIDLAFLVALLITGWGEALGYYDRWDWFDRAVHVVVPMLFAPVAYIALARADLVLDPHDEHPDVRRGPAMFVLAAAFGMALGALWEIAEWAADAAVGTNLSEGNDDTLGDLVADACGSVLGAGLLVLWSLRGWGTVRRIPGDNRYEAVD